MGKFHPFKTRPVFHGYWIVLVSFFFLLVTSGCGMYAFSLFIKPLEADLGWGRGNTMVAVTIFLLVMGMTGPVAGRLIERYEARKIIATGAFIAGLGFVSLSLMNSLYFFYLSYAVIGIGLASLGYVPSSTVVSNWFKKRRGTAIGVMSTGVGAGGVVLAPLIGGYLIPSFSWRITYLAMGIFVWALVTPLALLVIKTRPSDMGLYPDGLLTLAPAEVTEASNPPAKGITVKMALTTSGFWLIAVAFLTSGFGQVGALQTLAPHLEDIGFTAATAAGAVGGIGLGSLFGKFIFGWLCDRMPAKYACSIGFGLQATGIVVLLSVAPTSQPAIIWLGALVLGLGAGSWLPTMSILVSTNFGLASYGAILGLVNFSQSIGVSTGPLIAGFMHDVMNTYHWAFIVFLASYAVAIPAILASGRPKMM